MLTLAQGEVISVLYDQIYAVCGQSSCYQGTFLPHYCFVLIFLSFGLYPFFMFFRASLGECSCKIRSLDLGRWGSGRVVTLDLD